MAFLYYSAAIILVLAAAFMMWFFVFGRRTVLKEGASLPGVYAGLAVSALLCILMSLVISYDMYRALSVLEAYGDADFLHLLFIPVSALAAVFLMIPVSGAYARREASVPGNALLLASLIFMLVLNLLCVCVIQDGVHVAAALCFLAAGLLCCVVVYIIPQFSESRYKEELKKIDRMLSDAQSAHYEAVKKSSIETRRARHDMKNHMIALRELAVQSRKEELLAYIDSITEQIEAAAPPYRSGNDIADVIIADKHAKAEKRGLELEVSGDLAGLDIESADLVTILSNLLDNAIEAVSRLYGRNLSPEDKRIVLEFRKNSNFVLMIEKNRSVTKIGKGTILSEKNSPDHGFGISNIRRAVKKYGGEFNISCSEEGELYIVEAEVMLPLKDTPHQSACS